MGAIGAAQAAEIHEPGYRIREGIEVSFDKLE
jgi:hypothetical protein